MHKHEWVITMGGTVVCTKTGDRMPNNEAKRRLNATEELSAEDAREHASDLYFDKATETRDCSYTWEDKMIDILRAYAERMGDEEAN